jgi:hypothetical protein
MALTQDQCNRISEVVKSILLSRVDDCPELSTAINDAPLPSNIRDHLRDLASLNIELPYLVAIASKLVTWPQYFFRIGI